MFQAPGFEYKCVSVALLLAPTHEGWACHLARAYAHVYMCVWAWVRLFWVTVWVRCSQAAALCKSAPTFSSHKSLLATNCHGWQPSQKKEREGRQGVRGLKKSLRDEIKAKKGTWQHLEKRHCLRGEIYLCERALISGGWEQGELVKLVPEAHWKGWKKKKKKKISPTITFHLGSEEKQYSC